VGGGFSHSCALLANGTVKCWGSNSYGELGDGTTTERHAPVLVSGVQNATSLTVGTYHGCAGIADGTVRCWGRNHLGQLGDGTTVNRTAAVNVIKWIDLIDYTSIGQGTTSSPLVVPKPAKTKAGQLMIMVYGSRIASFGSPAGWTGITSAYTPNSGLIEYSQVVMYRVATSADDSVTGYSWTHQTNLKDEGAIMTFDNVDTSVPILAAASNAVLATASITAPSVTTSEPSSELIAVFGSVTDDAITPPTDFETWDEASSTGNAGSSRARTLACHKRIAAPGATGNAVATIPTAQDNAGSLILLKVAP
jgi:hypothetical protein